MIINEHSFLAAFFAVMFIITAVLVAFKNRHSEN
jgi:hypothetical protein